MYTEIDIEKLEAFVEAVENLNPKNHVTNPMNTRHADMYIAFGEGIKFSNRKYERAAPLKHPRITILNSRIKTHLNNHRELYVYCTDGKLKFRNKKSKTLSEDCYTKFIGKFTDAGYAAKFLKVHIEADSVCASE
jgi:hypothetical protein